MAAPMVDLLELAEVLVMPSFILMIVVVLP
jgi:hypothetical protein